MRSPCSGWALLQQRVTGARRASTTGARSYRRAWEGFGAGGSHLSTQLRFYAGVGSGTWDDRPRRHRFARVTISRVEARLQRLLEQVQPRRVARDARRHARRAARDDDPEKARALVARRARAIAEAPARAARGGGRAPRQLGLFDEDVDDEVPDSALAVPGLADGHREREWLAMLIDAADEAAACDSKLRYLLRLLRRAAANRSSIFTEYRDTLLRLAAALPSALQPSRRARCRRS